MKEVDSSIINLFSLAIKAETTTSLKERQTVKMQAGKVRKALSESNNESIKHRSGIKLEN